MLHSAKNGNTQTKLMAETLFDAFRTISINLDMASVKVIYRAMEKCGINLVNFEGAYYFKEESTLTEFSAIASGHTPKSKALQRIITPIFILQNIQNGILNKPCCHHSRGLCSYCRDDDGLHITTHICQGLSTHYLFEKLKMLEEEVTKLKKQIDGTSV